IFMVGDMKQSIYRFRMARPELFVEKSRRYSRTSGPDRKIELHSNFRSRREDIDSVNRLFRLLMQEEVGNIEYTEEAALHPGLAFPPYPEGYTGSPETEVLCLDPTAEEEGQADAGDVGNDVLEALMTGQKIREILSPERGLAVLDGGRYRRAEPKDITILMRSRSRFETFRDTLESMDIPCVIDDAGSFYISMEVTLVLNLLSVLDNPLNDIPLASLLQSVLYRFTDSELAEIRAYGREKDARGGFLFALKAYEGPLMPRIDRFLRDMERYRRLAGTLSVSGLVRAIYEETGLPGLMAAFPGGAVRRKNLYSLLYRAEDFEKTSYQGIFNFIRYVEKRLKLDTDEPAAQAAAENAVTIQTIHKSKGLQYPIVFVCGCGGKLNASDETGDVLMDQDFGIGVRTVDVRRRVKKDSFLRQAIQGKIRADSRGEELRVLYVAMTRAQEKLILTGVHKPSKEEMKTVEETGAPKQYVSREERKELVLTKGSYMEWIRGVVREAGIRYSEPGAADVAAAGLREEAGNRALRAAFEAGIETLTRGSADTLGGRFAFPYIYDDLYRTAPTSSVSALKARHLEEMEAEGGIPWHAPALTEEGADGPEESGEAGEGAPSGGRPGKAGRRLTGAEIGTAYHLVFRYLPETGTVSELLSRLCGEGLILPEEKATINIGKIEAFRDSSVGRRFFRANREGKGFRERPFVIGVPVTDPVPGDAEVRRESPAEAEVRRENPEEVRRESPADPEFRMIQGVIDLYFEEPDGLVIADYKTDRVKDGAELVRRYRIQLELYKQALEQATGKTVKECWIYSTSLGEEIRVL
ncbi:MAG: UvrD-helicase domain-containing protein, partial [Lachnospiraceae bacterium]|nr:UvrD-helicase domain-containing protein [Lachnospiraceae bacterium]